MTAAIDRDLLLEVLEDARAEMLGSARLFLAVARRDDTGDMELPRDQETLRLIHRRLQRLDRALAAVRGMAP